jgi:hypothetical protein
VFLVAFLVWGLNAFVAYCQTRLWDGRNATFHVDSMLTALSVMGAAGFARALVLLWFWLAILKGLALFSAWIATSLFF